MKDKITKVLKDKVDPILAAHYGGCLTKYENGIAYVRLTGACASCPSAQQTIEDVVKSVVTGELDEVKDVILDDFCK